MAKIFPFPALRYDPQRVPLQAVVTQPYDKITPAMQERYYAANPHNLVRIILGRPEPGDGEGRNVYSRASASFAQWRHEGILRADSEPSFYVYSQGFQAPGGGERLERRGFMGLGQIEDYANGVVFRHEQTLAKPKADRLNLLRATRAHFGQIFMLYSDPGRAIDALLSPTGDPIICVKDEYGVEHRVWRISAPDVLAEVATLMSDKKLIIADGHHRYETALNYRNECRQQAGRSEMNAPYERMMMTFINMDAPGLVILPTHRVVFGLEGFSVSRLRGELARYFEVEESNASSTDALVNKLRDAGRSRTAVCLVTSEGTHLLTARPGSAGEILERYSSRQRQLDVVQLHAVILEKVMGISPDDIRDQKHVLYFRDAAEAIDKVRSGEANAAFLINPVRIEQMRDVAFAAEVMPQKSTDFYPKLLSGLTIYALD